MFECFYDCRTIELDVDAIGEDISEPELLSAEAAVLELLA